MTENVEDNLLLENDFHEFFKVQWLHFSGEADKRKSTYFNSSGLDVLEIIQIGFIFDRGHCQSLSLASVKSSLVLPFWYRSTRVVMEKGPLNVCVCN